MSLCKSLVWQLLRISLLKGLRDLCSRIPWNHQGTLGAAMAAMADLYHTIVEGARGLS